VILNIFL